MAPSKLHKKTTMAFCKIGRLYYPWRLSQLQLQLRHRHAPIHLDPTPTSTARPVLPSQNWCSGCGAMPQAAQAVQRNLPPTCRHCKRATARWVIWCTQRCSMPSCNPSRHWRGCCKTGCCTAAIGGDDPVPPNGHNACAQYARVRKLPALTCAYARASARFL